ncbi:cytochrome P450 4C1 [Plutella xylostella]|uniref:cytochrome P450 4C1 n=1 Tax=Plutella xylostella TaxID=51655 RepID=UPI0020324EF5|nr:cytochrome P450 4C1 [Plutella xylostella]
MSVSLLLLGSIAVGYIIWYVATKWRVWRVASKAPMISGYVPIVGHAHKFLGNGVHVFNVLKDVSKETNERGGVATMWFGPYLVYVVTDPETVHKIANECLKKHFLYSFGEAFVGQGLFTARSVPIWKRNRKLLVPAFNQHILDGFLEIFNEQSRVLVSKLASKVDKGKFDHFPALSKNALEIICRTALGVPKLGENLVTKEYSEAASNMFSIPRQRFVKFWYHNDFLYKRSSLKRQEEQVAKIVHDMSNEVMQTTKLTQKDNDTNTDNYGSGRRFKVFLDLMLELRDKGELTDQQIREELDTMIAAGYDTSSTTLMYTLLLLGSHPEVQDKVYRELTEVFGNSDRDVTKADMPKLVYTEAVLKESLRVIPIVQVLIRYAQKDVKLKNVTIPKDSTILLSVAGMHSHECWGPDVEVFRPERWISGGALIPTPAAFSAFSVGRRNCIGKTYATMSIKTSLAHLLRHYRVTADMDSFVLKQDFIIKPESGWQIALQRRN